MAWMRDLFNQRLALKRADDFVEYLKTVDFTDPTQRELAFKYVDQLVDQYSPRSVSRRIMAWSITIETLALAALGTALYPFNIEWAEYIFRMVAGVLGSAFLLVGGLYFGKEAGKDWIEKYKGGGQ